RDVTLQAELVEQRLLRHLPFAHHRAALHPRTTESGLHTRGNDDFFNGIGQTWPLGCWPETANRVKISEGCPFRGP
ncbi:MAG: hypothetical protein J0J10_00935, partial [Bosea sp.]|uniref:hypothetical protein n=1 Tax=Bosea sp. (in: a-proteobacteria) TaxID=1871050 RepID=UPI001AD18B96